MARISFCDPQGRFLGVIKNEVQRCNDLTPNSLFIATQPQIGGQGIILQFGDRFVAVTPGLAAQLILVTDRALAEVFQLVPTDQQEEAQFFIVSQIRTLAVEYTDDGEVALSHNSASLVPSAMLAAGIPAFTLISDAVPGSLLPLRAVTEFNGRKIALRAKCGDWLTAARPKFFNKDCAVTARSWVLDKWEQFELKVHDAAQRFVSFRTYHDRWLSVDAKGVLSAHSMHAEATTVFEMRQACGFSSVQLRSAAFPNLFVSAARDRADCSCGPPGQSECFDMFDAICGQGMGRNRQNKEEAVPGIVRGLQLGEILAIGAAAATLTVGVAAAVQLSRKKPQLKPEVDVHERVLQLESNTSL